MHHGFELIPNDVTLIHASYSGKLLKNTLPSIVSVTSPSVPSTFTVAFFVCKNENTKKVNT